MYAKPLDYIVCPIFVLALEMTRFNTSMVRSSCQAHRLCYRSGRGFVEVLVVVLAGALGRAGRGAAGWSTRPRPPWTRSSIVAHPVVEDRYYIDVVYYYTDLSSKVSLAHLRRLTVYKVYYGVQYICKVDFIELH